MMRSGNLQTEIEKKRKRRQILWGIPVWADSYFPNDWGLYNVCGNVSELAYDQDGSVLHLGGSFRTEARYMNLNWMLKSPFPGPFAQADAGFRPIMGYIPPLKE